MERKPTLEAWGVRSVLASVCISLVALAIARLMPARPTSQELPKGAETASVISSGAETLSRLSGGTREVAQIRLQSGEQASAIVLSGGPLSPGDVVAIRPTVTALPSQFRYEIIAKRR
jgi:hypothetical protein